MTIVAQEDTRNNAWASDQSMFGQRMLLKMGWSHGKGLGKNQQGTSTNLRAIRREDGLGIGAKTDRFGGEGFSKTSRNFHGLLASLKAEHGEEGSEDEKKKRKREKKRDKKRRKKREEAGSDCDASSTKNMEGEQRSITLATNRVSAGHSRKMLASKDLANRSKEDMAAIFGVKVSTYESSSVWGRLSSSEEPAISSLVSSVKKDSNEESASSDVLSANLIENGLMNDIIDKQRRETKKKDKKKDKKKRKRKDCERDGVKSRKKR